MTPRSNISAEKSLGAVRSPSGVLLDLRASAVQVLLNEPLKQKVEAWR